MTPKATSKKGVNEMSLLLSPTPRRTGSNLFLPELTLFAALFPEVPCC
jgi:hypothetical protein